MIDIIIPAYKSEFLRETLNCFEAIESKFGPINILVFCDGPNAEIDDIASSYPNISYYSFRSNLGGQDLVAHWMRCLQHSTAEYIWLFSDDDVIDETQLTLVLTHLTTSTEPADCYRLRVNRIDAHSNTIRVESDSFLYDYMSFDGYALLTAKFKFRYDNVIPNFIFRRSILKQGIGIRKLPLAWMSDDLFWFDIANSYSTCQLPYVMSWRLSNVNISASHRHKLKKINAVTRGVSYLCLRGLLNKKFSFLLSTLGWYMRSLWRII